MVSTALARTLGTVARRAGLLVVLVLLASVSASLGVAALADDGCASAAPVVCASADADMPVPCLTDERCGASARTGGTAIVLAVVAGLVVVPALLRRRHAGARRTLARPLLLALRLLRPPQLALPS